MEQRTEEWYEFRKTGIGASEAACCLGIDPWKNQHDLWLEKLGLKEPFKGNEHTERGLRLEEPALRYAEERLGLTFKPAIKVSSNHLFMFASLDGLTDDNIAIEIKCPANGLHETIPAYYYAQLQHQMYVIESSWMYYMSFDGAIGRILQVKRDDAYIEKLIEAESRFWQHVLDFTEPEHEIKYVERNDKEYHEKLMIYLNNKKHMELWKDLTEKSRDELLSITEGNTQSLGYKISERVKPGIIDYKQIVKDHNIDISPYRKPASKHWDIRETKDK